MLGMPGVRRVVVLLWRRGGLFCLGRRLVIAMPLVTVFMMMVVSFCIFSRTEPFPAVCVLRGKWGIFIQGTRHEHRWSFLRGQGRGG